MKSSLLPQPRQFSVTGNSRVPTTTVIPKIDPHCGLPAQGYRLRIEPTSISLVAPDAAGEFYGQMTLRQLGAAPPACVIEDWPDFAVRGAMLDISRDKVPTMATLFALVDQLSEWKINHLELYMEHTFAYRNHRTVWEHASPMTAEEVRQLDAYCRERFIELVPNQNSFGHFERWLKHPAYRHLAESLDGPKNPTTLCPVDPQSVQLLDELYAELLPNFSSRKFNVGGDETWELGLGRSREECDRRGKGRVYLEFILKICELAKRHGRTPHVWGDIIGKYPELVAELPKDLVMLAWGYEAHEPAADYCRLFAGAGLPFYVCPGTSSWNALAGRTDNCLANLRTAATNGLKFGATGFLNTDWGDKGHWQTLSTSYLGFAAGAALAWCESANRDRDWPAVLDAHVFQDAAHVMGKLTYDLGNAYLTTGLPVNNGTVLWRALHYPPTDKIFVDLDPGKIRATSEYIAAVSAPLANARMTRPDAALVQAEYRQAARMLQHACRRVLQENPAALKTDLQEIIVEHQRLWLARNRPGGLPDSVRRLEARLADY